MVFGTKHQPPENTPGHRKGACHPESAAADEDSAFVLCVPADSVARGYDRGMHDGSYCTCITATYRGPMRKFQPIPTLCKFTVAQQVKGLICADGPRVLRESFPNSSGGFAVGRSSTSSAIFPQDQDRK
jgi:hypothetical protein